MHPLVALMLVQEAIEDLLFRRMLLRRELQDINEELDDLANYEASILASIDEALEEQI